MHLDARWRSILFNGARGFPPVWQERDPVAVLNLMDRFIVLHAVGLGAPDDPHVRRRCAPRRGLTRLRRTQLLRAAAGHTSRLSVHRCSQRQSTSVSWRAESRDC
jgi:hypothetical protein